MPKDKSKPIERRLADNPAPLLPWNIRRIHAFTAPFKGITSNLTKGFPQLASDLNKAQVNIEITEYLALALIIGIVAGTAGLVLSYLFFDFLTDDLPFNIVMTLIVGFLGFTVSFLMYVRIPSAMAMRRANEIDRDLSFALKDLTMQINSGVTLMSAMRNIADQGYGVVSSEFARTLDEIEGGESFEASLTNLAIRTDSEFLSRTIWQVLNTMKSGGKLDMALSSMVGDISEFQKDQIIRYGKSLSVITTIYLVVALVFPSVGVSFWILFLTVMGIKQTTPIFIITAVIYLLFVTIILSVVKSIKPMVF